MATCNFKKNTLTAYIICFFFILFATYTVYSTITLGVQKTRISSLEIAPTTLATF